MKIISGGRPTHIGSQKGVKEKQKCDKCGMDLYSAPFSYIPLNKILCKQLP